MVQESEIVTLLLGVASISIFFLLFRGTWLPQRRFIRAGFACILSAYVCTVIEGFLWHGFFNTMEHLSYALAGFFFASGARSILRMQRRAQKDSHG